MIDVIMLVCLAVFYSLMIGRTLFLMTRGIRPFVIGRGKKGIEALVEIGAVVGILIWSVEIVLRARQVGFHLLPGIFNQCWFDNGTLKMVGLVLICGGEALFVYALISFGRSWRIGIDRTRPSRLVTGGAFSLTRNPIYIFFDLYFTGTFLVYGNAFFLIAALIMTLGTHFQIIQEERFLSAHYGEAYRIYRNRVKRYFLFGP